MGRVAVAAGAGMDTDVLAFLRVEAIDHSVVELDEVRKHLATGPRVPQVVPAGEAPFGEVDRHPLGAVFERPANILLALVDEIGEELLAGVALHLAVERIKES